VITRRHPIAFVLLVLGGVAMILPLGFMFATSLKDPSDIYDMRLLPAAPTLENYLVLLVHPNFLRWFLNSFVVAAGTTVSVLFFDSLVGYTLAKFRFAGRV
jgi:multiple sugar transport system permease protein